VHYESHFPERALDAPRAWLSDDDVLDAWVVERQDEILGHVAISRVGRDGTTAYRWREMTGREPAELVAVSRLFVRPTVRRTGLGTALLETAVAEIRARGLVPVLQVADSHTDAVELFEQAGWRLLSMDQWGLRGQHQRVRCYTAPPS
jgi:GNAT superfamily N-acetyltransferase